MNPNLRKTAALVALFLFFAKEAHADFRLLDALEEFGEKRFVRTSPTRVPAGPLKLHPSLRNSVSYDDNILLEPDDKREDVIYHVQPGIIAELPINTHQLAVGYEADWELFNKRRDSRQNHVNQNFFALGDFRFPDWYVNILENFSETSSRSGTTFTQRVPRLEQVVNPKIGYKWKRTTFETGFRHFWRHFRNTPDQTFDFQTREWTAVIFYDLFARLKALIDYQVAQIDYFHNSTRDGMANWIRLGLEGELRPNLFAKLRVGPQIRNYYKSSEQDFRSVTATALVEYQMRPDLKLHAKFSREPVEATFGQVNYYTDHLFAVGFDYRFHRSWTLYHESSLFFHHYKERETVGAQTGFRRDGHQKFHTGLRYAFRQWWSFDLAYDFQRRDSNFGPFDYNENRVTLSSDLQY